MKIKQRAQSLPDGAKVLITALIMFSPLILPIYVPGLNKYWVIIPGLFLSFGISAMVSEWLT